jgi:coenzyme PQQ precursor peptide PqqA
MLLRVAAFPRPLLTFARLHRNLPELEGGNTMKKWKKPILVEIAVGLEINAYACAEV